jgi:hypothetical protein
VSTRTFYPANSQDYRAKSCSRNDAQAIVPPVVNRAITSLPSVERIVVASIDRIVVTENGASQTMTPDQWKAMPITQRVKWLGGAAKFFAGASEVPPKVAIQELR